MIKSLVVCVAVVSCASFIVGVGVSDLVGIAWVLVDKLAG